MRALAARRLWMTMRGRSRQRAVGGLDAAAAARLPPGPRRRSLVIEEWVKTL